MALKHGRSEFSIGLDKAAFHAGIRLENRQRWKVRQEFRIAFDELERHNLIIATIKDDDVISLRLCGAERRISGK